MSDSSINERARDAAVSELKEIQKLEVIQDEGSDESKNSEMSLSDPHKSTPLDGGQRSDKRINSSSNNKELREDNRDDYRGEDRFHIARGLEVDYESIRIDNSVQDPFWDRVEAKNREPKHR